MSGGLFDGDAPTIAEQIAKLEDAARLVLTEAAKLRELLMASGGVAIVKTKPHPIKMLLTRFDEAHQKRFNLPAAIVGARDSAIVSRLLKQYDLLQLGALVDQFFESDDDWTIKRGFTVPMFSSAIGSLIATSATPRRVSGLTPKTAGNDANARTAGALIREQGRR